MEALGPWQHQLMEALGRWQHMEGLGRWQRFFVPVNDEVGSQKNNVRKFVEVKHVREVIRGRWFAWEEWVEELRFATWVLGDSNQPGAEGGFFFLLWWGWFDEEEDVFEEVTGW